MGKLKETIIKEEKSGLEKLGEVKQQENGALLMIIFDTILNKGTIKDIPEIYDKIPKGYVNNVAHRGNYSEEEMAETLPDGTRKLLHIDLDFGKKCRLCCPHCFKRNSEIQNLTGKNELGMEELKTTVLRLKELGLKTIKICGAGEPFDNKDLIPFLERLYENDIRVSIFTKGYVIGDDEKVEENFGYLGIHTSKDLCKKIKELDVSILLSVNSFDPEIQKKYSGATKGPISKSYIKARDTALVNLINAGLNEFIPGEPTRLSVVMAPMKPENLNEIPEIYKWARMRNIYPLGCPANNAGKGIDENERVSEVDPEYEEHLVNLYAELYIWNIEHGIITLEQLRKEGISLYPGAHPCTQTRVGGYLNLYGELMSCPGHKTDLEGLIMTHDITTEPDLEKMWKTSANYKRTGLNQHCIARDGVSLHKDFYDRIMNKVEQYFKK